MQILKDVLGLLDQVMGLEGRSASFTPETPLLGALAELDSMAVIAVIAALEDQFGISVADDEISAETFASVGTLVAFVNEKLAQH
jgi:acyl carrier protein